MDVALIATRLVVGGWFVWLASRKLGDSRRFWRQVMEYRIVGPRASRVVAAAMPPIEFVAGLLFAAGFLAQLFGPILLGLLALFTVAMGTVLARGIDADCGCGSSRPSPVRPALIVRNVALGMGIVVGSWSPTEPQMGEVAVTIAAAVVCVVVTTGTYRSIGRPAPTGGER